MMQAISYRVQCGNTLLPDVVSIDYSFSQNAIGAATIQTTSLSSSIVPEQPVMIDAGTPELRRVFTGYIDSYEYNAEQGIFTIQARDVLKKALDTFLIQEIKFGVDVEQQRYYYSTYSSLHGGTFTVHEYASLSALHSAHPETVGNITHEGVKAEAVVQWLLVMCGIDERTSIRVHPSQFFIGDITPVRFHLVSVYDAIQQIVELLGWWFYADAYGICRFHPRPSQAAASVSLTAPLLLQASATTTNEFLRNYVEVVGASGVRVVERAPSPYLGSTPYRGVLIANEFIDTPQIASYTARRVLTELNRLQWKVQLRTLPFPVQHTSILRVPSVVPRPLLIESFSATISADQGYTYTIQTVDVPDDVFFEDIAGIIADFHVSYLMTIGDPKCVCRLDASPSFALQSSIVSWNWSIQHQHGVQHQQGQQIYTAFDVQQLQTTGVLVQLVVTDSRGQTASTQRTITLSGVFPDQTTHLYRVLYACFGTSSAISLDGGQTWRVAPIDATYVAVSHFDDLAPEDAPSYALFLTTTGHVYRTADYLQTYQQLSLSNVSFIAISPSFPWRAYAASQQTLYISNDAGVTFQQYMTFPSTILHFEPDRTNHNILYVVCAQTGSLPYGALFFVDVPSKTTENLWSSWNLLQDRPLRYIGGVSSDGNVVQWVTTTSGVCAVVNGNPTALALSNVASITPTLYEWNRAHAVFTTGNYGDLLISSGVLTYTSTGNRHAFAYTVRDGSAPNVIYYATASGVEKSVDGHRTILPLYTPQAASHVMYGDLYRPEIDASKGVIVWGNYLNNVTSENDPFAHGSKKYIYVAALSQESTTATTPSTGFYRVVRPTVSDDIRVTDVYGLTAYGLCERRANATYESTLYSYQYAQLPFIPIAFRIPKSVTPSGLAFVVPYVDALASGDVSSLVLRFIQATEYVDQTLLSCWYRQGQSFYHVHAVVTNDSWLTSVAWSTVSSPAEVGTTVLPSHTHRSGYELTQVTTVYPSTRSSVALIENNTHQAIIHAHNTSSTSYTEATYPANTYNLVTKPNPVSYGVFQRRDNGTYWLATQKTGSFTALTLSEAGSWVSGEGIYDWHQSFSLPEIATYEFEFYVTEAPAGSFLHVAKYIQPLNIYDLIPVPVAINQWVSLTVENAAYVGWHRRHFFYRYRKTGEPVYAVQASRNPSSSVLYVAGRTKVFAVSDYGRGSKTLLLEIPQTYEVLPSSRALSVNYSKKHQSDAICVIARKTTQHDTGLIIYRYHANDPWKYHAWSISNTSLGALLGAWVLTD